MKKKIFGAIAVLTIAIAISININLNKDNDLSSVSLANLEALANNTTNGTLAGDVKNGAYWSNGTTFCCGPGNVRSCEGEVKCNF